ncbi:MAG: acetylxylan esterase [Sphingobacteriia bacterium]
MAIEFQIRKITKALLVLVLVFALCPIESNAFQRKKQTPDVAVKFAPNNSRARFSAKFPIKYKISLTNNLKADQEGTLVYTITNEKGEEVVTNSMDVKVNARKKLSSSFEIPLDIEGDYKINATLALTDYQENFNGELSYKGPPRKQKDRRGEINPYNTAWAADNINKGTPSNTAVLAPEKMSEAPEPAEEEAPEEEGEIITKIKPAHADGLFFDKEPIKYSVTITNKYRSKQEGTFNMIIETEDGKVVNNKEVKLKLGKRGVKHLTMVLPAVKEPGIYNLKVAVNTTTYDDTSDYAFGYDINKINQPFHMPPGFNDYWKEALAELAATDPQYKITKDEGFSSRYHNVYRVDMMGIGNVPFFGYLTVPKLPGRYPVLIGYGGYRRDVLPMKFGDFISFAVNVRGLEKASIELINPDKKEQIVLNIEDKDKYVYRGIYTDCVRAVDFIFSHADMGMDLGRVVAFGGSQGATLGIVTAALTPDRIGSAVASNPVFADWTNSLTIGQSKRELKFPINSIDNYIKKDRTLSQSEAIETLNYFDLMNFMPRVQCPILYAVGLLDEFIPPGSAIAAYNKLNPEVKGKSELYVFPNLGHEVPYSHNVAISTWFSEKTLRKKSR